MNAFVFYLQDPEYLWAGLIIPVLLIVFLINQKYSRNKLRKFGEDSLISRITPENSKVKQYLKFILSTLALICLVFHFTHPVFSYRKPVQFPSDIFLLVDVSNSMLAEDLEPNRLEYAKSILVSEINNYPDARIGLIPFAGQSLVDVPLTRNINLLKERIKSLNPKSVPVQGTLINQALNLALSSFSTKTDRSKIILLLTDGENHEAAADSIAFEIRSENIHVLIIGIGSIQGANIPMTKNTKRFLKDREGNLVLTRSNPGMLDSLAKEAGGKFIPINNIELNIKPSLHQFITESRQGFQDKIQESRFPVFLIWSMIFLVLEFVLFERKNRKWGKNFLSMNLKFLSFFWAIFLISPQAEAQFISESSGKKAYQSGNYLEAYQVYYKNLQKEPEDPGGIWRYNLACTQYHLGKYKSSDSLFKELIKSPQVPKEIRLNAYYNSGNSEFKLGLYPESIEKYKEYLRSQPNDSDAWYNLAYARWKMKKPLPPPPPPNQEGSHTKRVQMQAQNQDIPKPSRIKPHSEKRNTGDGSSQNLEKNW